MRSVDQNWTIRKIDYKYLESFELWCWRRMEKLIWKERVKNEVLPRTKEEMCTLRAINWRKANWFGHILRMNCLLKHIIGGLL